MEDDLKNPCLDYIEHIVMSLPEATFTAGGTTYTTFGEVKANFLSGKLSEVRLVCVRARVFVQLSRLWS